MLIEKMTGTGHVSASARGIVIDGRSTCAGARCGYLQTTSQAVAMSRPRS
jgi:hypothetical protein